MSGLLILVSAVDKNNEDEFVSKEDFEDQNSIQICCAWGDEIEDGTLSYIIDEDNPELRQPIYNSIEEWDKKIKGLAFEEVSNRRDADVEIYFREDGKELAGETRNYFDRYGFITKSYVLISKGAFGIGFKMDQIEQIAKHEMGHVLGLGHATFAGSLMTERVNPQAGSISDCEIEAVYEANHWKLKQDAGYDDNDHSMHYPNREYVECN